MLAAEAHQRAQELETQTPEEILRWAFATFPQEKIAISTAFGPEGCALVAMASQIQPGVRVFTIDTDFLFEESIALRRRFLEKYAIDLQVLKGEVTLAEQNRRFGLNLWQRDTDQCCALRKVEPTKRALHGLDAWIAGLRRDQSGTRAEIEVVELYERDSEPPLVKVNPLVSWTRKHTWDYLLKHEVPYSPLLDQGYKSIGCWPCTKPVAADAPDQSERAGRWGGTKAECGIHTFMAKK
jgi:phosphoadenosine phosphosulfate reductase